MNTELLAEIGKEKMISILKDPFKKICVKKIWVQFADTWDNNKWESYGWVEFKNGNTEGKQQFKGETFDEVVRQIKTFIDNLQNH